MLEPTVKELVDYLHRHFPPGQSYSKDQLERAREMPAPVTHYINQQMVQRVTEHVHRIAGDRWIDTEDPSVRRNLDQLEQALETSARVPADEWSEVVSNASREIIAYLVDPVSELADFVFREHSSLSIPEVRRRMTHFSPYSYLRSVFTAYADRKSLGTIDQERFKEVLGRIDRQMVADYTADKWERLFHPLYELLEVLSPSTEEPRVRVELLRQLAANKQFDALVHQLDQTNSTRLRLADIRRLIEAALAPSSSGSEQRQPEEQQEPRPRESDQPQPRWKQFQRGNRTPSSGTPSSPRQSRRQTPPSSSNEPGEPLWQRFQRPNKTTKQQSKAPSPNRPSADSSSSTSTDSSPESPSSSLETLEREVVGVIPGDQRERFIRRLFSGSRQEYAEILAELRDVRSWEEASSLIAKKVFLPHQVNIYSEPAVTFTDLVEARFQQTSVR